MNELNLSNVRLIARSNELDTLNNSFQRVLKTKSAEIITVAGLSGSGKSSLVNTFRDRTVGGDAFYCSGKCDISRSKEPFSVLKDSMAEFCSHLADRSHGDRTTESVIRRIRSSIGGDAQALTAIIPGLSQLISTLTSSSSSEVEHASAARDRLAHLFRVLIRSITSIMPLVLFWDDLQWIDSSSLQVIRWIATDHRLKSFMLVGAYRDNEVDRGHRLLRALDSIESRRHCSVSNIALQNLRVDEVNSLIAMVLKLEPSETPALAEVVHEKTLGNPFFALQFLQALEQRKMLVFSFAKVRWEWSKPERIRADTTIASNVVDLIANKMKNLASAVQDCLQIASCLSSTISVPLLEKIMDGLEGYPHRDTIKEHLEVARREGFLQNVRSKVSGTSYKFVHDRIQQAAYSLIPEGAVRDSLHFRIGRGLMRVLSRLPTPVDGSVSQNSSHDLVQFVAADQLYRGQSCISGEADRVDLARVSLMAGTKAIKLAAFAPASQYLCNGIDAMSHIFKPWETYHDLHLSLYQAFAEASWCIGAPLESEMAVRQVLLHAKSDQERMQACLTLAQVLGSQEKHQDAVGVEIEELRALKVFPGKFKAMKALALLLHLRSRLRGITVEEILSLPRCEDERVIVAMKFAVLLAKHATFHGDEVLQLLGIVIGVKLILQHGTHHSCISSFAQIGALVSVIFGDAKEGYRLGTMSTKLMERLGVHDTFTVAVMHQYVSPWYIPLPDTLEPLRVTYDEGLKQGNVEMAMVAFSCCVIHSYLSGLSLDPILEDANSHVEALVVNGMEALASPVRCCQQFLLNLAGKAENPLIFTGSAMNEAEFVRSRGTKLSLRLFYMWKMCASYYFADFGGAETMCRGIWKHKQAAISFFEVSIRLQFSALIPLAMAAETGSSGYKRKARAAINAVRKAVTREHKAINLAHKLQLLDAEFLSLNKRKNSETIRKSFDQGIRTASRAGVRQDAALGNLRAGLYFLKKDVNWASHYLTRAVELFRDWGAHGVAKHWEDKFANLISKADDSQLRSSNHLGRKRHSFVRANRDINQVLSMTIVPKSPSSNNVTRTADEPVPETMI